MTLQKRKHILNGFTLTELIVSIGIVGTISTIAIPQYFSQLQKTHQSEAASQLSILQTSIATYNDEFGFYPTSWNQASEISAVMTAEGVINSEVEDGEDPIELSESIKMLNRKYALKRLAGESGSTFTLIATPTMEDGTLDEKGAEFNVMACMDLETGASDLRLGRRGEIKNAVKTTDLRC